MCIFTNCLAQGAMQEQSGEEQRTAPGGGPAGRAWAWAGPGGKGCPLEEGPSSEGVKEVCGKSGPRLAPMGSFCDKRTLWSRPLEKAPLLGADFSPHLRFLLPVP